MSNSWLARQRKSELVELAQLVGLKDLDGLRKSDLELAIDEHLSEHAAQYQSHPKFQDYFKSRARAGGSPIKKEAAVPFESRLSKRRSIKPAEEAVAAEEDEAASESSEAADQPSATATATDALASTPGRALVLARRLQLPATPADVAEAVDRSAVAVRTRVASLYKESGLGEATKQTRQWLSTVHSVLSAVALFELYKLRQEILPDRYAFTVPAVKALGTPDYPVHLPDMFALVTAAFWAPAMTWLLTSLVLPAAGGYFFNLRAAHQKNAGSAPTPVKRAGVIQSSSSSSSSSARGGQDYSAAVDPLMFSVVKAIVTYVVYAQGVTFGGLLGEQTIRRIDDALYSGWRGVLVGTAVSGLTAVYDAVLRK
ncbi:hypothetical protein VTK26DRAFT_3209 [Humicola hyalothermophila]